MSGPGGYEALSTVWALDLWCLDQSKRYDAEVCLEIWAAKE